MHLVMLDGTLVDSAGFDAALYVEAVRGAAFARATYFGAGAWDRRAGEALGYEFIAVGGAVPHPVAYIGISGKPMRYWRGSESHRRAP
jgi:hypothetical protein